MEVFRFSGNLPVLQDKFVKKVKGLIKYAWYFLVRQLENTSSSLDVLFFEPLITAVI